MTRNLLSILNSFLLLGTVALAMDTEDSEMPKLDHSSQVVGVTSTLPKEALDKFYDDLPTIIPLKDCSQSIKAIEKLKEWDFITRLSAYSLANRECSISIEDVFNILWQWGIVEEAIITQEQEQDVFFNNLTTYWFALNERLSWQRLSKPLSIGDLVKAQAKVAMNLPVSEFEQDKLDKVIEEDKESRMRKGLGVN